MPIPYQPGEALTCQQFREIDILAIEHLGIPGLLLMENAGRAAAEIIFSMLLRPSAEPVVILCGAGNNGGDGFVIARHLHNSGVPVTLILAANPQHLHGDAAVNFHIATRCEIPLLCTDSPEDDARIPQSIASAAIVVDALIGTGASGPPRPPMSALVTQANRAPARRIAIDIPTGLSADEGTIYEPCFRADATITMVAPKLAFAAVPALPFIGRVFVVEIGLPRSLIPGRQNISDRP